MSESVIDVETICSTIRDLCDAEVLMRDIAILPSRAADTSKSRSHRRTVIEFV